MAKSTKTSATSSKKKELVLLDDNDDGGLEDEKYISLAASNKKHFVGKRNIRAPLPEPLVSEEMKENGR